MTFKQEYFLGTLGRYLKPSADSQLVSSPVQLSFISKAKRAEQMLCEEGSCNNTHSNELPYLIYLVVE